MLKKRSVKIVLALIVWLALLDLTLIGLSLNEQSGQAKTVQVPIGPVSAVIPNPSPTPVPTQTPAPYTDCQTPAIKGLRNQMLAVIQNGNEVSYRVTQFDSNTQLLTNGENRKTVVANGCFVTLSLDVANLGKKATNAEVKLSDENGESFYANNNLNLSPASYSYQLSEVQPGLVAKVQLIFELPLAKNSYKLVGNEKVSNPSARTPTEQDFQVSGGNERDTNVGSELAGRKFKTSYGPMSGEYLIVKVTRLNPSNCPQLEQVAQGGVYLMVTSHKYYVSYRKLGLDLKLKDAQGYEYSEYRGSEMCSNYKGTDYLLPGAKETADTEYISFFAIRKDATNLTIYSPYV